MTLKDLVPPMELCKQIPEGEFSNSLYVWSFSCDKRQKDPFIEERDCIDFCRKEMVNAPPVYSAPTLAEIMEELRNNGVMLCGESDGTWTAIRWVKLERYSENDANAATAALRLWLSVMSEKSVMSEESDNGVANEKL